MDKRKLNIRFYKSPLFENGNSQLSGGVVRGIQEYLEHNEINYKANPSNWSDVEKIIKKSLNNEIEQPLNSQRVIKSTEFLLNLEDSLSNEDYKIPVWNLVITPDLITGPGNGFINEKTISYGNKGPLASTIISTAGFSGHLAEKLFLTGYRSGFLTKGECFNENCIGTRDLSVTKLEKMVEDYQKNKKVYVCKVHQGK